MFDLLIVIIFIAIFAIVTVFGLSVYDDINDMMQLENISQVAKDSSQNVRVQYPSFFDNAFMLAVILFWVMLLVSSFLIDANPVFFIITIILLMFTFMIGMTISNTYQDIMSDTNFVSFSQEFPKMSWVMDNFLLVIIGMGLSSAMVLYAKART